MAAFGSQSYGLTKPLTQSIQGTMTGTTSSLTNANLVGNSLPAGALKTFLSATYALDADAEAAFRAAGGIVNIRQTAGTASPVYPTVVWKATASTPSLDVIIAGGASNEVLDMSVTIPHSVIQ
jgi:hypothetical protein